MTGKPVLPAYGRGCITELMPALLGPSGRTEALPADLGDGPRVLLVLDGLGWDQLQEHRQALPTLAGFSGGPITTVAPSTTAAALPSITTSLPPGEHGLIGYRMVVDDAVFNCLRWGTAARPDSRRTVPPTMLQPYQPFLGSALALVTKAEFRRSGFTEAHLRGGRLVGYRTTAVLVHEVARLLREGERAVYAYYDGVDKVAHEYGLGSEYQAELAFTDRLVADIMAAVPSGTTVTISADHGQVDCGRGLATIHPDVLSQTILLSGEARFRWLHAAGSVAGAAGGRRGAPRSPRLGARGGPDARRGLVRAPRQRRRAGPPRRRRPAAIRRLGVRRPGRHRADGAHRPPWLADLGRDARAVHQRQQLTRPPAARRRPPGSQDPPWEIEQYP